MSIPRDHICKQLEQIEQEENVRIIFACESGSRAWGFESSDSDFDVRFIYAHPLNWYLSIDDKRDVIERPLDSHLVDLSGWELRKALRLMRKSNPPLFEWLQSPIVYAERPQMKARLVELIPALYSPKRCMYHYLNMANGNFRQYLKGETVNVKKYFYVLRPVLACLWIEAGLGAVPMEFSRLVERLLPPGELRSRIEQLVIEKKNGEELAQGEKIPVLNDFLEAEISRLSAVDLSGASHVAGADLDQVFRDMIAALFS